MSPHGTQTINIEDYSIDITGQKDSAPGIQSALNAGSNNPIRVRVPKGTYLIGKTLKIHSNTVLECHKNAVFHLADNAGVDSSVFLITNANYREGNAHITVTGGVWDGNAGKNPRGADAPGSYTGVMMDFRNVRHLRLQGMCLKNPETYHIRLNRVSKFAVSDIKIKDDTIRPNQDGIHLAGQCHDGVIENITASGLRTPNDDLIALNADDANYRAQNLGMENGPISNIAIRNIYADDCHSFLRLLSTGSTIENVVVDGVHGGFREHTLNMDAGRNCAVPVVPSESSDSAGPLGLVRNIQIKNVEVFNTLIPARAYLKLETIMDNFILKDFTRVTSRESDPGARTAEISFLPKSHLQIEEIEHFHSRTELILSAGEDWTLHRGDLSVLEISMID